MQSTREGLRSRYSRHPSGETDIRPRIGRMDTSKRREDGGCDNLLGRQRAGEVSGSGGAPGGGCCVYSKACRCWRLRSMLETHSVRTCLRLGRVC